MTTNDLEEAVTSQVQERFSESLCRRTGLCRLAYSLNNTALSGLVVAGAFLPRHSVGLEQGNEAQASNGDWSPEARGEQNSSRSSS